jgi:NADH:ubiquinone oxidoreductase subunit 4 (subunit M)
VSGGSFTAAYYALRLFQRAMHNRKPEGIESREVGWREGGVIAALTACIVALALWPGLILDRAEDSVNGQLAATGEQAPAEVAQR